MEGKKILEKVSAIKEDKAKKEQQKSKQQQQIEAFFKCMEECTWDKNVCAATKLRECPCCHNVLTSTCSKASCRGETGSKPIMIKPFCDIGSKKSLQFESDEDDIEDDDADEDMSDADDDMSVDDDLSDADKVIDDGLTSENGERDSSDDNQDDLKRGDCVKLLKGNYPGYFALVTGDGYGGEIEINYFEAKYKWWALKEKDLDSRDRGDLKKVDNFTMDKRSFFF